MAKDRFPRGAKLLKDETNRRAYKKARMNDPYDLTENRLPWYRDARRNWKRYRLNQWKEVVCQ